MTALARSAWGLDSPCGETPVWNRRAACRDEDPELFFPDTIHNQTAAAQVERAKAVCRRCPVQERCLADALASPPEHGVWAALTAAEIRRKAGVEPVRSVFSRPGVLVKNHDTLVAMLTGTPRATYRQVAEAIGSTPDSVEKYWQRHRKLRAA